MVVSLLGALKCGAAYLPIDPGYPEARVLETLADARPAILITTSGLAEKLPRELARAVDILILDAWTAETGGADNPDLRIDDACAAYVIYTSGSTGKPKGVQVSHRNVARLIEQTQDWFHFTSKDVWTMFHSLAFDFSVWEIWGCLLTGGRLVIVPFEVSRSPEEFYFLLSDERVTVLNQTPSAFSLLMQIEDKRPALPLSLRVVIFGGEALYPKRLRPWFDRHGDQAPELVNMYGITETTVHVSYRRIVARDIESEVDSLIGVPIPDMQIHLLDNEGKPAKDGETGEMYIGGGGVALGYLRRPTLNAARFLRNPFGDGLLYRTGDLARRRKDGELVYLGRIDGQVKINGFRIELGEVEAALEAFPEVLHSCVIPRPDASGGSRLAAYFVARKGMPVEVRALSSFLAKRLPSQMLPSFYTQLDSLPLTGNGKVDRASLPADGVAAAPLDEPGQTQEISATQETIAAAWRTALGVERVGLDDNFFDIGGSSLLLIQVRSELRQKLDRAIPVTWMFEWTTIRKLAEKLDEMAPPPTEDDAVNDAVQARAQKQRQSFSRFRGALGGTR
jgi:amino acid adenylation domain-containing protein